MELEAPAGFLLPKVKSPKSVPLPFDAIVINSIELKWVELVGLSNPPANIPLVADETVPTPLFF